MENVLYENSAIYSFFKKKRENRYGFTLKRRIDSVSYFAKRKLPNGVSGLFPSTSLKCSTLLSVQHYQMLKMFNLQNMVHQRKCALFEHLFQSEKDDF